MEYKEKYYTPYKNLCETGRQTIYTKDLNKDNIDLHFQSLINILKDGIETDDVKNMMINVVFQDNIDIDLAIFDYLFNIMFWQLNTSIDQPINSVHLVFFEDITKREIKSYIDNTFIDRYRKYIPFISMNQIIDSVIGKFRNLRPFQMYLANTLNLEDTIDLMKQYPEFDQTIHFNTDGILLEDIKDKGMEAVNTQIKYIKNSNHCLRDSFRTGEAISPKQYKEVNVNIGTKPDGMGSIFPRPIKSSFVNGGLQTPEDLCVDSSVGRVAQILAKTNVGESGEFARKLENNNQDTILNIDPNYICDTKHFQEIVIDNKDMLNMFNMRYYRLNPKGVEYLLNSKKDFHLIGQKLYFRSPMTCASAARGHGICFRCYGDLAYSNREINIGQIAAEGLSSIYTQILLSAKHLLESLVIKLQWNTEFYDMFKVTFNTIGLYDNKVYKGYKLIIDEEIKTEEDLDDINYNFYINSFTIKYPNGDEIRIHTSESDNIYFVPEFYDYVQSIKSSIVKGDDEDRIELDMVKLMDFDALFIVEVKNNELSATMNKIKKLIDNKTVIQNHDRNTIIKEFISTNISGGIKLNSVHFEVLLMNQIRAIDDELELPDWSLPNAQYQILTLSKSLSSHRSITIRLQTSDVQKVLLNPQNRNITKSSMADLYYMEKPQQYLGEEIVSDEYKPKSDIEENVIQPVSFDNPKLRVGRRNKK